MKNLTLIIALAILTTQLMAFDVVGQRKAIIITKHPVRTELRSLKSCLLDKSSKVVPNSCDQIGSKEYYSVDYLKELRVDEYVEASLKTLADVGIVIGMVYGGAVVGAGVLGSNVLISIIGASGGAGAGAIGGIAIAGYVKKLNPVRQFKQAATLSDELINDIDIEKSDEKIEDMVELLNEIL